MIEGGTANRTVFLVVLGVNDVCVGTESTGELSVGLSKVDEVDDVYNVASFDKGCDSADFIGVKFVLLGCVGRIKVDWTGRFGDGWA